MAFCKNCGNLLKEEAKFCPNCGCAVPVQAAYEQVPRKEEIPVTAPCKNCGAALKEGAKFCPNCGAKRDANPAFAEESESPPETTMPDTAVSPQTGLQDSDADPDTPLSTEEAGNSLPFVSAENVRILRLISDIECLTQEREQSSVENRKIKETLEKTKLGLIAAITAITAGVVGIIIAIGIGYQKYSSMESSLLAAETALQTVEANLETAEASLQLIESSLLPINATSIKVGNSTKNGRWLTNAGDNLYSSNMRYFSPVMTYNSVLEGEITFSIKILRPNGTLMNNPSISPIGYTYTVKERVLRGNNQTLDLAGWGNENSSSYSTGEWTVEVWYENACLRSEKVRIY
jgi:RNA polymerase subunit RPABC4/transcription elongation factor Spt4